MKKRIILTSVLVVIMIGVIYINTFSLKEIKVTGCELSESEQVVSAVQAKSFANNTFILYLVNKFNPIDDIPFVEKIDIEFMSKNVISVTVYEKSMAGCIEYMDGFVYFDKDGVILEASSEMLEGIPCIKGLNYNQWEVGEKLPIDDESKFQSILSITQLIEKYELDIDGIKFTAENEIILIHEKITIELGEGEYLAIQMMNLGSILEGLEGREGTLYMKDFNSENATASFSEK